MGYSRSVQKRTSTNYVPFIEQTEKDETFFVTQYNSNNNNNNNTILTFSLRRIFKSSSPNLSLRSLWTLTLLLLLFTSIKCFAAYRHNNIGELAPSLYFEQPFNVIPSEKAADLYLQTPPLDSIPAEALTADGANYESPYDSNPLNVILPARVRLQRFTETLLVSDLNASPIFNQQQQPDSNYELQLSQQQQQQEQQLNSQNPDFVEIGSGQEWDNQFSSDESTSLLIEETATIPNDNLFTGSQISPTPLSSLYAPKSTATRAFNRAPELQRRLPKLAITAGQSWRYFLPVDTFIDEDGDLSRLRSRIRLRQPNKLPLLSTKEGQESFDNSVGTYSSWLQYDATARLLYAFPTELNSGVHEFELEVTDAQGATSSEFFEIIVRQHQSTRAFTHLLTIEGVGWSRDSFSSVVDALDEFVKRLSSSKLYLSSSISSKRSLVVHNYYVNNSDLAQFNGDIDTSSAATAASVSGQPQTSFSITWSNESLPVHPCNLSQVESIFRPLIAQSATNNWSLVRGLQLSLPPSAELLRALEPDFEPQRVSLLLQGACDGESGSSDEKSSNELQQRVATNQELQVRLKIGKLNFKLGEPFEYRIPAETFGFINGGDGRAQHMTRNLELSLHTIDGLTLDNSIRYSFMEFDRDSQTLYGLPYSQSEHAGQLELLLTARDRQSGAKVREVFIVDVVPFELSALNNLAFRMSLYLSARSATFGPRERVHLSRRMEAALQSGPEKHVTVVGVDRFARGIGIEQQRVIRVADAARELAEDSYILREVVAIQSVNQPVQHQFFYKFTWTNASIGRRGDCPVEVIRQHVLDALTQLQSTPHSQEEFMSSKQVEDNSQNASVLFFAHLRNFFEPQFELYHLRFEPLNACFGALFIHDVGNRALADLTDSAAEQPIESLPDSTPINLLANNNANQRPTSSPTTPTENAIPEQADEYWLVVVVLILVLALIFVVIMFFLGMHTYKMNQDKRFELQVRLAQARQNSMFLSSMVLANQLDVQDVCSQFGAPLKSMYAMNNDEKSSRRPVILDAEKQLLINGQQQQQQLVAFKPTAVQLQGNQSFQTLPIQPNMSFSLDQPGQWPGSPVGANGQQQQQHSMTLHRRITTNPNQRLGSTIGLNHSQSILTVASLNKNGFSGVGNAQFAAVLPTNQNGPFYATQVPVISDMTLSGNAGAAAGNYFSLQRNNFPLVAQQNRQQQTLYAATASAGNEQKLLHQNHRNSSAQNGLDSNSNGKIYNNNNNNNIGSSNSRQLLNKTRNSPSFSSSTSATNQSVITNANYVPAQRDFQ